MIFLEVQKINNPSVAAEYEPQIINNSRIIDEMVKRLDTVDA